MRIMSKETHNNTKELSEGFIPVEYIEYRPKQERLYAFGEFEKYKEALELTNRINTSCKDNVCQITSIQLPDNVLFCVVFPESVFEKVDYVNKEKCTMCKTPISMINNIPFLYRFMEAQYVEMFFETGMLKLTTFEKCKELEDENRKDTKEGQSELFGYDGDCKLEIGFGVGGDVILLCTSLCSEYKDKKGTIYNKYIEIFDVQGLILAIAEQLSKSGYVVKTILFGPCFYSEKEFHNVVHSEAFREKMDKEQSFDWDELSKITNTIAGYNIYFQKPIEKRQENEFRFLWIVDNIKKNKDVFVTVPHPEAYCRLIDKQ